MDKTDDDHTITHLQITYKSSLQPNSLSTKWCGMAAILHFFADILPIQTMNKHGMEGRKETRSKAGKQQQQHPNIELSHTSSNI